MIIRDEKLADCEAIHELVAAAFQRPDEAVLINRLRSDDGAWRRVKAAMVARDVPAGQSWVFQDHHTVAEVIAEEAA